MRSSLSLTVPHGLAAACAAVLVVFYPFSAVWGAGGTDAATFLEIPVGGAPAAMGSAYTALASDVYAPIWNPGGLAFIPMTEITGEHLSYLDTIHYESLGFVHQLGRTMGWGLSGQ